MKLNNARQAKGSASGTKKRRFMTKFPTMPPRVVSTPFGLLNNTIRRQIDLFPVN